MDARAIADQVRTALAAESDPVRAVGQQAYMKSDMPFYGVPVPRVRAITRTVAGRHLGDVADVEAVARELWDDATRREERYAAIAATGLRPAVGRPELIPLHEYQARTGAWWDFVDEIAHRIADLLEACPQLASAQVRTWMTADSLWLRRLAILSQLQRRDRTDAALLTDVIEANSADGEFFIRKAIGWALRDYARTAPGWVRAFVEAHDLSPLSRREALKHL